MALSFFNVFLLLLLITPLDLSLAKKCILSTMFQVHVINKLFPNSTQLRIHCASKNRELGDQILPINEDFNWSFCGTFINRDLYFCHFWLGAKDKAFNVFDDQDKCIKHGETHNYLHYCKWEVRPDGFYLEQYDFMSKSFYMDRYYEWS
ncbi:hypothetical protein RND71_020558 [Anisodus tanguticus]|uniref:S-protein homolog n=1 Tax=Anisodus tanguticus TaxID=243964 RepID=A0AAE1S187_9SOLA|nr:hypothetical protein RND71_020558 [Anisodus tanguticus]